MKIPLVDLQAQYRSIRADVHTAMEEVLTRGDFILGGAVKLFEEEFAAFCGTQHAVSCASGTDALVLALKAMGIGPGDEVITVSHTWVSTVFAISMAGAKPVLVDIDPATYNMDPAKIEPAITPRTRAVLPVHLYGQPADMTAIGRIAKKHKLMILEDACQSHGAEWEQKRVGGLGHCAAFSFYPGKNLGAYGDGGIVTTADGAIARNLRLLRNVGQEEKHRHELVATVSRLDTLQAAVLRVKLRRIETWTEGRRQAAAHYNALLKGLACTPPVESPGARHVYHLYVIQVDRRDEVLKKLNASGVMAQVHYPRGAHLQPACADLGYGEGSLPASEKAAGRILSLPIFPEITAEQRRFTADKLAEALA